VVTEVGRSWIAGDEDLLERLLERLYERRAQVPELIDACHSTRLNPFRGWPG